MLRLITKADYAAVWLACGLAVAYALIPAVVQVATGVNIFDDLIVLALVSSALLLLGAWLPLFDWIHSSFAPRIAIDAERVCVVVWAMFVAFATVVWVTAPTIPLIAAMTGADAQTIAVTRELFLKARTGWQGSFVYINALFTSALLPFTLAVLFLRRSPYRWPCFLFFFLYSISFVEKAFFLKAAMPVAYLALQGEIRTFVRGNVLLLGIVGVMLILTRVSAGVDPGPDLTSGDFFSMRFVPRGSANKAIWRAVAVPVVTAADGVRLFNEDFAGQPLGGATSSLVSALLGQKRVAFERLTFASEFGQNETGTGSANAVYFVEALVNFGWAGVVVFSLVIGVIMRAFARTRNEALRSLWVLFALGVYSSGLIGVLLSLGFGLIIPFALLTDWRTGATGRLQSALSFPGTA
jgi:hypothetical protein